MSMFSLLISLLSLRRSEFHERLRQSNGFSYYSVYSVDTNLLKKRVKTGLSRDHDYFRSGGYSQRSNPFSGFMLNSDLACETTESLEMPMDCHDRSSYSLTRNNPGFIQTHTQEGVDRNDINNIKQGIRS